MCFLSVRAVYLILVSAHDYVQTKETDIWRLNLKKSCFCYPAGKSAAEATGVFAILNLKSS